MFLVRSVSLSSTLWPTPAGSSCNVSPRYSVHTSQQYARYVCCVQQGRGNVLGLHDKCQQPGMYLAWRWQATSIVIASKLQSCPHCHCYILRTGHYRLHHPHLHTQFGVPQGLTPQSISSWYGKGGGAILAPCVVSRIWQAMSPYP